MEDPTQRTCRVCAAPRPAGRTLCAPCLNAQRNARRAGNRQAVNAKRTESERRKRAERRAAFRCAVCATPLPPEPQTHTRCPAYRAAANACSDRHRRRKRAEQRGVSAQGDRPLHVGRHVKAHLVRTLSIKFDIESHTNIRTLKHRERERRAAEAKAEGISDPVEISRRASLSLQTSALLRETIKRYHAEYDHLPERTESRRYRGKFSMNFHFGVDDPTLAIIEHYAKTRGVSVPRTVRDLVCAATYPPEKDIDK